MFCYSHLGFGMLTSTRKLHKLFIKFIEWGKIAKAEKLILQHPNLEMPWQKAFENAVMNKMIQGARWIYENSIHHGVHIDIHRENNKLMNYLLKQDCDCDYVIKWYQTLEMGYPGKIPK